MDPAITGALISGGTRLLGGLLGGGNKDAAEKQHFWNYRATQDHGLAVRSGAEQSGFNPLTYLGAVGGPAPNLASGGGTAPLASGRILADTVGDILMEATGTNDALEEEREKAELDRLRKENEILNAGGAGELVSRTVRTIVNPGGIGTPRAVPASNVSADKTSIEDAARKRADMTGNEGRDIDVAPVVDSGGTMQITNPWLGGSVSVPTIDGDEPLGFDEFLVNAPVIMPQVFWNYGKKAVQMMPDAGPTDPTVKYPSLTNHPIHLNPKDAENIRKNRKPQ